MTTSRLPYCLAVAAVGLLTTACANVKPTHSGYLSDYSQLHTDAKHKKDEEARPAAYVIKQTPAIDSFYVEDIAWRSPRPKSYVKNPKKEEPLLKALRTDLVMQLSKIHPVVDQPGPHTARVRAAITDEVNAHMILNILASIVAVPVSNGGATIEAEVLAPNGKQLAAVDYARPGGFFDVVGYYWPNDHAKQACKHAAIKLRELIQGEVRAENEGPASSS